VRMGQAEFEALRARGLQVISTTGPATRVQPAKGRTTVKRPATQHPAAPAGAVDRAYWIKEWVPEDHALHACKLDPTKVLALDLSMAKTGIAWGKPGEHPEGTATVMSSPRDRKDRTEAQNLMNSAYTVAWWALNKGCGFVVFSEFYNSRTMLAFRANVALRGAVMAELARFGIPSKGVPEISARKHAKVDLSKRREGEPKQGWMKLRARARLEELGLGYLQEDEGDAAILLIGSKEMLQKA